jgi:hypothetical protein
MLKLDNNCLKLHSQAIGYIYQHVHIWGLEMTPIIGIMLGAVGVTLLNRVMKGRIWPLKDSTKMGQESKDKVIEIDDYEILD